jgi:quercetin dioxygenase-like cupin family protein
MSDYFIDGAALACQKGSILKPVKTFKVFGEPVEILVTGQMTGGQSSTFTQTSPPGGGPPPHSHRYEHETFFVLEGEYEFLENGEWHKISPGETVHAEPGSLHTFRNAGASIGKILIFTTPGGFEKYLEEISVLSIPQDMQQLLAVSERYGITFAI